MRRYRVMFEDMCEDESFIGIVEVGDGYDEYAVINGGLRELANGYNAEVDSSMEEYLYENYQYVDGIWDFWVERRPTINFTIEW